MKPIPSADTILEFNKINTLFGVDKKFDFMNHGYYPIDPRLTDSDVFLKTCASLYLKVVENVKEEGSLLEIGCGRGGGLNVIKTHYPKLNVRGCDLVPTNILNAKYSYSHLDYDIADAMDLPYEDKSFNYVLNIESSHCYPDINKFYSEVFRVLADDGEFYYSDIVVGVEDLQQKYLHLSEYFTVGGFEEITKNVYNSCLENCGFLKSWKHIDGFDKLHSIFESKVVGYRNGEHQYFVMRLHKRKSLLPL
jgi:O-methyltransferase